jgi:small subunit ribosomal protein S1
MPEVPDDVLNPELESKTLNTQLETAPQETLDAAESTHNSGTDSAQPTLQDSTDAPAAALESHPAESHSADVPQPVAEAHAETSTTEAHAAPHDAAPVADLHSPAEELHAQSATAVPEVEAPAAIHDVHHAPAPAAAHTPAPAAKHVRPTAPAEGEEGTGSFEDFAAALESFDREIAEAQAQLQEVGDNILTGTVVKLTDKYVVVDVALKSEGLIPLDQVMDHTGQPKLKPGDIVEVVLEHEEVEGGFLLSYDKAQRRRVWDTIEKAAADKTIVPGLVVARVKGGLTVDIGIKAFLPGSQVEVRPVRNLDAYIGQTIDVRVIKLNKKRGNVVVSRKELLEEELTTKRSDILLHLEEGSILTGTVKNLTDYGAFVDLGGIDGLLHITDMSWGRLTHPRDLVQVGDEIQVKVLKFDKEKQRVSLGFKQLTPDPWLDATERYPIGARVRGRILSVTDYGAFVELEQGIEGLVHVSEMTWSKRMKHPSKLAKPSDEVDVVVLAVNPSDRRISLGMKQLQENPWEHLDAKYPTGAIVEGRVRNLTDFGAFIEIEDGIDGLVHVSNLSWIKRIKHPSEVLKKGEKVKAVVLGVEPEHRRLSLGVKQLQPDVWETFFAQHRVGDVVHGKVLRTAQFGAFVQIAEGVEGLCHVSEAVDGHNSPIKLEAGQEYEFKIVKMNEEEKKVGLSLRGAGDEASRADVEAYKQPVSSSSTTTLGDLVNWKKAEREEA